MQRSLLSITVLVIALVLFSPGTSQSAVPIEDSQSPTSIAYTLDLRDAKNHYVTVEAVFAATGNSTDLMMAVWTPGSYLVREFARHIDTIRAVDEDGNHLAIQKTRKNRWAVNSEGVSQLKIKYRIYCDDLSVRTNFIDGQFAVLNGAPTFLTVPDYRNDQHTVQLILPPKWQRSATSLRSADNAQRYSAGSFDELVDSPIVAGNISIYPFEVSGVPHQLVNVGESGYWNGAKAASDLKKVVAAHHEMWRTIPYSRYLFINVICGRGGGLEHDNSTLMMTSRWSFRDEKRYQSWLSLASHEFFHTWNIRRLRPKSLMIYDYENEVYTPSLWIAEGITSYYEDLLLARSGLISPDDFLKRFGGNIASIQKRPGRLKQSLQESSYDAWIKFYRNSSNASDTQISYYSKGAVVAYLLDAEIRKQSNGKKCLDDVMRLMFAEHSDTGYSTKDFRTIVDKVSNSKLAPFFDSYVESTKELDYSNANDLFGLKFKNDEEPSKKDEEQKPQLAENENGEPNDNDRSSDSTATETFTIADIPAADSAKQKGWLGFSTSGGKINRVDVDSPATRIGLNLGDELIAINGIRIQGSLEKRLEQFNVGDELTLLIARREILTPFSVTLIAKPEPRNWDLKRVAKPSEEQQIQFNSWLDIPGPTDEDTN